MKIGVVGAREGRTINEVFAVLKLFTKPGDIIVSGGAVGVDSFARQFAKENGLEVKEYFPLQEKYPGQNPYHARNEDIVKDSEIIIAFPTYSPGTWNTINHAKRLNKRLIIIKREKI